MLSPPVIGALIGATTPPVVYVLYLVWKRLTRPTWPEPRISTYDLIRVLNKMYPFPGSDSEPEPVKLFPHERKRLTHEKKGLTHENKSV